MAQTAPFSLLERRREEILPKLDAPQIEEACRFGAAPQHFEPGAPAYLILEGSILVIARDRLGGEKTLAVLGAGEISQLAGGPTLSGRSRRKRTSRKRRQSRRSTR